MAFRMLAVPALALVFFREASAQGWAQFCNDNACRSGCGEAVDINNAGCLNEAGRNSILFHFDGIEEQDVSLIFSPTPNCPCQNECLDNIVTVGTGGSPYCYDLNGNVDATSFRFVGGHCSSLNNC